jgi:nitroreductase
MHRRVLPVAYDRDRLPTPEQMDELLKERRTIRRFRPDKLERALLEEIVSYGIYAPTNNYDLRALLIDDAEILFACERVVLRFTRMVYRLFFKPKIVFNLIRLVTPAMTATDKVKMEEALEAGEDFHLPPAVVLITGDRRVALSVDSAQYALYNMILYAQSKRIGSRLRGTWQIMVDRNRGARKLLGLGRHEHILGGLELGYPAVKFANKVQGKALPMRWVEGVVT